MKNTAGLMDESNQTHEFQYFKQAEIFQRYINTSYFIRENILKNVKVEKKNTYYYLH